MYPSLSFSITIPYLYSICYHHIVKPQEKPSTKRKTANMIFSSLQHEGFIFISGSHALYSETPQLGRVYAGEGEQVLVT